MTGGNVEILVAANDAFNRRDLAAWLAVCGPDLVNVPASDWPESDPVRGPEAVWTYLVTASTPWAESTFRPHEIFAAGEGRVVAHIRAEVQGRTSGAPAEWSRWQVATISDGRMIRLEWFADRADAVEAAGA